MKMQAIDEIAVGEDLTPALRPIAAVLDGASITSHCSACFRPLPPHPFTPNFPKNYNYPPIATPTPLYCSLNCSSLDSPLHFSSAELHLLSLLPQSPSSLSEYSAELRLSLRLLHIFHNLPQCSFPYDSISNREKKFDNFERIMCLMTNRESLVFGGIDKTPIDCYEIGEELFVRIKEGARLMAKARQMCVNVEKHESFDLEEMVLCLVLTNATEVEIDGGSLGIALYDATFSWINHSCSPNSCYWFLLGPENDQQQPLRITPACDGLTSYPFSERNGYGPKIVLRSIKDVSKGEEITIAYIDLLLPKKSRQVELWSKYRFICGCNRCDASPISHLDYALQACYVNNTEQIENLIEKFEGVTNDYLSLGNAESCCQNLENLLLSSECKLNLHPFHHISLNAFITLTFAYKARASDLVAEEGYTSKVFTLYVTSCAYSLLVAGVGNHLFTFEPALVTSVLNFWIDAGKSLLELSRSFRRDGSELSSVECDGCGLANERSGLYNCIVDITTRVWRLLCCESVFLRIFESPLEFSWIELLSGENFEGGLKKEFDDEMGRNLVLLGVHCLRYGAVLSRICCGLSVEMNYNRALMQIYD